MFTILYINDDGSNKGTLCQRKHIFKYQYMYVHIYLYVCVTNGCVYHISMV